MATRNGAFTPDVYEIISEGARSSAYAVVPEVATYRTPRTVIDVGCGEGWWGKAFADRGCDVLGLDGPGATPRIPHRVHDLEQPLPADLGTFDLVVCLEVAEHLTPARADTFVDDLCKLGREILFSAAIPGQGGIGHLNEQWPAYWIERFAAHGLDASGALRWMFWGDDRVEPWYQQNLLYFAPGETAYFDSFDRDPVPVVHPTIYDARRR